MASLGIPLSVRLSGEDTSFLARLEIDGAVTASDKIRGLIRQARQRTEEVDSFPAALGISHDQLASAVRAVRLLEQECGAHSDVVIGLMTTAEEYLALALAAPRPGVADAATALRAHEARLVDCAARMVEQMLRWAVTPRAPAYDAGVVARRMTLMADLMQITAANGAARSEG